MFKNYSQLQLFLVLKYALTEATVSKTQKEFNDSRVQKRKTVTHILYE